MDAQQVYQQVGSTTDVIKAMVRAEKYGQAQVHGATIMFAGYQSGATEFNAATAQYKVRY